MSTEDNKALSRSISDGLSRNDVAIVDELYTPASCSMIPLALADGPEALMRLRLDTRHDLVEARVLYARRGLREVEPFNTRPYADHWLEKALA